MADNENDSPVTASQMWDYWSDELKPFVLAILNSPLTAGWTVSDEETAVRVVDLAVAVYGALDMRARQLGMQYADEGTETE